MYFFSKTLVAVGILALPNIAYSQTVEELNAQAALDTAQAARITAQVAIINAENERRASRLTQAFGTTSLEGNEGNIELGENALNHIAQAYVYKSLDEAAEEIRGKLCSIVNSSGTKNRVIFGDPVSFIRIKRQMKRVTSEIETLQARTLDLKNYIDALDTSSLQSGSQVILPSTGGTQGFVAFTGITTALTALPLIAGQFDNVASLFRTDTSITAANVSLDDATLIRTVRKDIFANGCATLINPEYSIPANDIDIEVKIKALTDLRNDLAKVWLEKQGELIVNTPAAAVMTPPIRADFIARRTAITAQVDAINTAFSALYTGLYTTGANGLSTLDTFYAANEVKDSDLFLELRTQQSSAITIETKKPLKGTRVRFGGLVAVSYELKDGTGAYKIIDSVEKRNCSEIKKSSDNFIPSVITSNKCNVTDG